MLKETGYSSIEELKAAAAKKETDTPEQAKKKEELYQANLVKFAVENDLLTMEDIHNLETVKGMSDEDLVFKNFAEEVKDEVIESLPEDATEENIVEAVRKKFEEEFPINAESERTRARAEAKLKKAAESLRKPLESSFNAAKSKFDDESAVRSAYPGYQDAMKKVLDEVVPGKLKFFSGKDGDVEIPVEIEVTDDVKKSVIDSVRKEIVDRPETFLLHKNGKTDDIKSMINDRVEFLLWKQLGESGKAKIAEIFTGIGRAKAEAGAMESFALKNNEKPAADKLTAQQEVVKSTRKL